MIFSPLCYHTRRGTLKGTSYATVMPYFTCLDNMWKSSLRDVLIAAIMQVHENREIGIIFRRHRTFEPFPHTMLGGEWEQLCLHAGVIIVLLTVKSFVLTSITNSVEAIGATDTCMLLVRKCEVVNSCGALIDPSKTRDVRRNRQSWTMTRYWVILWVLVRSFWWVYWRKRAQQLGETPKDCSHFRVWRFTRRKWKLCFHKHELRNWRSHHVRNLNKRSETGSNGYRVQS